MFVSHNGGQSWKTLQFPVEGRAVLHALVTGPATSHTFLAAVSSESSSLGGVYRTRDEGESWEQLAGLHQQVWSLAASPADANMIAAGTEDGLFATNDGGESWRRVSAPGDDRLRPVVSIAFHPTDRRIIYAGTPHLAWKTTDGGVHWAALSAGMRDDSDVFAIVVDRRQPTRVFVGACSGLYRSVNGGGNWTRLDEPRTYFVVQNPSNTKILFAGTSSGFFQSPDNGVTWRKVSPHVVRGMAFDRSRAGRIFLASEDAGVLRSNDGGLTLLEMNQGLFSHRLAALTESGGAVLTSLTGDRTRRPLIVAAPPDNSSPVYALSGETLLRSFDGGLSWAEIAAPSGITALSSLPSSPGRLLAAAPAGVFASDDGGNTWSSLGPPPTAAPIRDLIVISPFLIAAVAGSQLLLSRDGVIWRTAAPMPGNGTIHGVAPAGSGHLLAATSSGMMRSDDSGASWQRTGRAFGASNIQAIACTPEPDHACFAAVGGIAYQSVDGGESWQALGTDTAIGRVTDLVSASGEPRRLFVLTEDRGVFELETPFRTATGSATR
jgi:photosystem II stability/assembly factor-like uncharacterized protein